MQELECIGKLAALEIHGRDSGSETANNAARSIAAEEGTIKGCISSTDPIMGGSRKHLPGVPAA